MTVGAGSGSPSARIMVVGEAWGEEEEKHGTPFVGRSGDELGRMLNDAGILRSECFFTNLVNARPPSNDLTKWIPEKKKEITFDMVDLKGRWVKPIVFAGYQSLLKEIELVKPKVIITVGNTSMWALCGVTGITKWRGSLLEFSGIRVVPTYHPAAVLRMWEWRKITVHDLARAKREMERYTPIPRWKFIIKPSFAQAIYTLSHLYNRALLFDGEVWLDFDIETTGGHIRCFAISWSTLDALCIPLMDHDKREGYWTVEEEGAILWHTWKLMTAKNVRVRGQNLLYDFQYTYRHWHFVPTLGQDTMLSHHVLWAGMPKSLLFQASMYNEFFINWKSMVRHNEEEEKEGS